MTTTITESESSQEKTARPDDASPAPDVPITIIEPDSGLQFIDTRELYMFRDLFRFLVWRNIKTRYAQSAIGIGWAVIQPVFSMLVFTVVFGKIAKIDSDGVPYAIFSFVALVPWTYFSNSVTDGTNSLVTNANMISKVYFPRVILPLSAVLSKLVDFVISMVVLAGLMLWFGVTPNAGVLVLPLLIALMMLTAAGLGMWLTALAIQYRDVKHAMTFVMQLMMYAAPVIYSTTKIPTHHEWGGYSINPQFIYSFNPMVGVIEGFRSALLGTIDMPWMMIGQGTLTAVLIAFTGALYFRKKEQIFADVA